MTTSAHSVHRDLAAALKQQATRTGEQAPSVRGADWRLATVGTVNTDGTVVADSIKARRMEGYQNPAVGDVIVLSQSSSGNWRAEGRLSTGAETAWTQPTLATGFTHNGNGNGNVEYRVAVIAGQRFMQWRGGVGITYASNSIQNGGAILSSVLAAGLRPVSLRSVPGACSASNSPVLSLKFDAQTSGQLAIVGTTTATSDTYATPIIRPPWVSLNGVQYALD